MTQGHIKAQKLYAADKCLVCGSSSGWIERHHRDGNEYNNDPDNVLVCCRRCHMEEDGRLGKAIDRAKRINQKKREIAPTHCSLCHESLEIGEIRNRMCKRCDQRVNRRLLVANPARPIFSKPRSRMNRARGTENASAKLTEDDVRYIRASQKTTAELARIFCVAWHSVNKVRKGLRWRHVS